MILNAPVEIALADAEATGRLGAVLSRALRLGDAVLLSGGLGAGKSTLARGLIRAMTRADEDVPSPTFTLVQFYESTPPVAHFDLYRLADAAEADELGMDEALDLGAIVVEWPQRLGARLPPDRLDIDLAEEGSGRRARLVPHGSWKGRELGL